MNTLIVWILLLLVSFTHASTLSSTSSSSSEDDTEDPMIDRDRITTEEELGFLNLDASIPQILDYLHAMYMRCALPGVLPTRTEGNIFASNMWYFRRSPRYPRRHLQCLTLGLRLFIMIGALHFSEEERDGWVL